MKVFAVLSIVVFSAVLIFAEEDLTTNTCKANIVSECTTQGLKDLPQCSAKYSGAVMEDSGSVLHKLQDFAINQLKQSFEFMLRASYFGNYQASRAGFSKLFRGMSDAAWNDAISVTKLIAQRGGKSVFKKESLTFSFDHSSLGIEELPSLGRALDSVKTLAIEANAIHHRATHHLPAAKDATAKDATKKTIAANHQHDAHIAHYIQEEFSGRYAAEVRALAGHATDLKKLLLGNACLETGAKCDFDLNAREKSLSLFLFDEYLLKL